MQTTIKLAVFLLLIVTAFSCQKEDENRTSNLASGEFKSSNDPTYLLKVSTNDWCTRKGSNCASTTVIVGTRIDNLIDNASDPTYISNYFSTASYAEWSELFPYVAENSNLLNLLQTGSMAFEIIQDPTTTGRVILRMHNSDDSVSIGFPFLLN